MNAIGGIDLPESDIHASIVSYCHKTLPDGCVWWHTPNSGNRDGKGMGWLRKAGVMPGIPDLIFLYRGCVLPLEIKSRTGKLNPAQIKIHERLTDAGFPPVVVRSLEEAIGEIQQFIKDSWKP